MIGFGGVVIASAGALYVGSAPPSAYVMPVLGMLALALATLLHKRFVKADMPVHQSLCIQCLSAATIFALFARREGSVLPISEWGFVAGIVWLVVIARQIRRTPEAHVRSARRGEAARRHSYRGRPCPASPEHRRKAVHYCAGTTSLPAAAVACFRSLPKNRA